MNSVLNQIWILVCQSNFAAGIQSRSVSDSIGLVVRAASSVVVLSKQHLKGLERDYIDDFHHSPVIVGVAHAGLVQSQRSVAGLCVVRGNEGCGGRKCCVETSGDNSGLYNPRRRRVGGRSNC